MKFGVIVFAGTNSGEDMVQALEHSTGSKVVKLWHKDSDLKGCDFIVLPGGYYSPQSLNTRGFSGFSPILEKVMVHAQNGGYVLGVSNGFKILTDTGLLPGTLLQNESLMFSCKNVYLKPISKTSILTSGLQKDKTLMIPFANIEGKYFANAETLAELEQKDNILFKYCNEYGVADEESNPNGSFNNIAGICNNKKNVFGMMPLPERAVYSYIGNEDGKTMFQSLLKEVLA